VSNKSELLLRYFVVLSLVPLVPLLLLELGLVVLSLLLPVLLLPLFAPLELLPEPAPVDELLPVLPAPEE